ncbi:hypothetical protein HRbin01_01080 [archaeon HR01]|nr:hypothetical protein HRbin01_01080 [archaeon HR01]
MSVDVDYTWVLQNKKFFSNLFRGRYVALIGRDVVGVGRSIQEAYEDARKRHPDGKKTPVLLKVDEAGDVQLMMGMAGG